jgi:hypothetical protein
VHLLEKRVINMIWLLVGPLLLIDWANPNDRSRWFAISSSPLFSIPGSVLYDWGCTKSKIFLSHLIGFLTTLP